RSARPSNQGFAPRVFNAASDAFAPPPRQAEAHADLLREVGQAVGHLFNTLKPAGNADRVLMMTFSEFGRRVKENGSRGTDHGSGSQMFLIGGKVKAGVVGEHPSLTDVPQGNLKFHTDFRQVYAAILDRWLAVSSQAVLGREFKPVDVLKS